jgi:hypothetical protein
MFVPTKTFVQALPEGYTMHKMFCLSQKLSSQSQLHSLDMNTSPLENVFCQICHTNHDTPDTFHKGITAVSLHEQERHLRGNNKHSVHLYSASYGGNHQTEEKGSISLIGKGVEE